MSDLSKLLNSRYDEIEELICLTFSHGTLYGIVQSKSSNTTHRRRNSLPNRKIFMCLSGWSTSVWNNLAFRKIRFAITRKRD